MRSSFVWSSASSTCIPARLLLFGFAVLPEAMSPDVWNPSPVVTKILWMRVGCQMDARPSTWVIGCGRATTNLNNLQSLRAVAPSEKSHKAFRSESSPFEFLLHPCPRCNNTWAVQSVITNKVSLLQNSLTTICVLEDFNFFKLLKKDNVFQIYI